MYGTNTIANPFRAGQVRLVSIGGFRVRRSDTGCSIFGQFPFVVPLKEEFEFKFAPRFLYRNVLVSIISLTRKIFTHS